MVLVLEADTERIAWESDAAAIDLAEVRDQNRPGRSERLAGLAIVTAIRYDRSHKSEYRTDAIGQSPPRVVAAWDAAEGSVSLVRHSEPDADGRYRVAGRLSGVRLRNRVTGETVTLGDVAFPNGLVGVLLG